MRSCIILVLIFLYAGASAPARSKYSADPQCLDIRARVGSDDQDSSLVRDSVKLSDAKPSVQHDSTKLNSWRLATVTTLVATAVGISQAHQSGMYWSDPTAFYTNIYDDWQYAHGADKFGHAFAGYLLQTGLHECLLWSGVDTLPSLWYSAAFSLAHQSMIEIRDGFSKGKKGVFAPYLGFSYGDMAANMLGASFPLLQHYVPSLKGIRYKYSLNPSAVYNNGGYYSDITNDYESEYHWLSLPIYDWLAKGAQKYWTPFLNIAIGHSVKGIVDAPAHYSYAGHHEWYISLDYNVESLPGDAPWWRMIKRALNFYKLPAPCIRISPGLVVYGIRL